MKDRSNDMGTQIKDRIRNKRDMMEDIANSVLETKLNIRGIEQQLREWKYSKTALRSDELGPGVFMVPIYIKKVSIGTSYVTAEYPKQWVRIFFSTDKESPEYIGFIHLEMTESIDGYFVESPKTNTLEIYTDNLHSEYNKSLYLTEVKV